MPSQDFAKVKNLNKFGEMRIEFNDVMKTDNVNTTVMNSYISTIGKKPHLENITVDPKYFDLMTIYVIPYDNWDIYTSGFEM